MTPEELEKQHLQEWNNSFKESQEKYERMQERHLEACMPYLNENKEIPVHLSEALQMELEDWKEDWKADGNKIKEMKERQEQECSDLAKKNAFIGYLQEIKERSKTKGHYK